MVQTLVQRFQEWVSVMQIVDLAHTSDKAGSLNSRYFSEFQDAGLLR
jgi:hypothetical protein